jgi:hypothetical protein
MTTNETKQEKPAAKPRKMTLESVKRGRYDKPFSALLYGTEGVGKSSWAADAPSPIFICTEDGTAHLDVARFDLCQSWEDIHECLDTLLDGGHEFRTVVIDTLDQGERLAWDWLLTNRKTESGKQAKGIEDYGYGKGYTAAIDLWRTVLSKLERLRSGQGMNVIMLAHSNVRSFTNPEGSNFDRYELSMNAKLAGMLKGWPDSVLFATYEIFANIASGERKAKGVGSGARIMRTERRPAFDAKNRYQLPFEMPLNFADFYEYAKSGAVSSSTEDLKLLAEGLIATAAGTKYESKMAAAVAAERGNATKLKELQNWLTAKLNEGSL